MARRNHNFLWRWHDFMLRRCILCLHTKDSQKHHLGSCISRGVKDSYPVCRQHDDGRKEKVRGHDLDNRWVMPYNPYLLCLFNCHINVEACGSIKVIKYLFKYIYKGYDRASVAVREARWVTPPEALLRIYGFDISDRSPSVLSLQLHLPDMHMVSFHQRKGVQLVLNCPGVERSMLTAYFKKNNTFEYAHGILY
uniref:UPI0001A85ACB related cluster n=1 Tax=Saccharum spontaneum TaxID=62335 RepID=A0A678T529_SACSP|nr:UPI0001A85ACB related cluster [Saccharum spontaneum]